MCRYYFKNKSECIVYFILKLIKRFLTLSCFIRNWNCINICHIKSPAMTHRVMFLILQKSINSLLWSSINCLFWRKKVLYKINKKCRSNSGAPVANGIEKLFIGTQFSDIISYTTFVKEKSSFLIKNFLLESPKTLIHVPNFPTICI